MNNDGNCADAVRVNRTYTIDASIDDAWRIVGDLYCDAIHSWRFPVPSELEGELLFCLLGGFGVTYEHGRSATAIISSLDPFSDDWRDDELFDALALALMQPQFEPRRQDGSLRRYRFPPSQGTDDCECSKVAPGQRKRSASVCTEWAIAGSVGSCSATVPAWG